MEQYDLYNELNAKTKQLEAAIRQLRTTGTEKANTERDYKILLREECLKLRDSGMAVGMINMTVYGVRKVADARLKRDIAEVVYTANLEAINSVKLQLRLLDAQISREWGTNMTR